MLFVGLGNPGERYATTRHNVGFMIVDALVEELKALRIASTKFQGELYSTPPHFLLKPETFMNRSGVSVLAVTRFYKIPTQSVVVIHDDLDLPFGAVRFKQGGGHGGHNGLKSIDAAIGRDYIRLRVGIAKPPHKSQVASYVLSPFSPQEQKHLPELIRHCRDAAIALMQEPYEKVASRFSVKRPVLQEHISD